MRSRIYTDEVLRLSFRAALVCVAAVLSVGNANSQIAAEQTMGPEWFSGDWGMPSCAPGWHTKFFASNGQFFSETDDGTFEHPNRHRLLQFQKIDANSVQVKAEQNGVIIFSIYRKEGDNLRLWDSRREGGIVDVENGRYTFNNGGSQTALLVRCTPKPVIAAGPKIQSLKPTGASFDCSKATSASARLICSDTELSKADGALGAKFKTASAGRDEAAKKQLVAEQLAWLRERNSRCGVGPDKANIPVEQLTGAKPCMMQVIGERITKLGAGQSNFPGTRQTTSTSSAEAIAQESPKAKCERDWPARLQQHLNRWDEFDIYMQACLAHLGATNATAASSQRCTEEFNFKKSNGDRPPNAELKGFLDWCMKLPSGVAIAVEDAAAIRGRIRAVLKRISEQSNTVPNVDRRKALDKIAVRLSTASDKMPLEELKTVELDAEAAVEIFNEAAEFKQISETANQRIAIVDAALEKLTFDAALIQEIKATIGLAKKAQGDANLQSLNEALSKLALLSDPDKLRRLKEAKDHGFDSIEAYDQYEEDKKTLSQSGIRLNPR
jgi:uncharacterized protein YecT (DUF1311 family)